ncbi:hypothetical protein [Scytonema sp. PCC 10023]|uniref:hypothetical protein n=1 Tax=Scytonema sp. PCC 10023 TaxID=1680591 RepID=UPI0039C6F285
MLQISPLDVRSHISKISRTLHYKIPLSRSITGYSLITGCLFLRSPLPPLRQTSHHRILLH